MKQQHLLWIGALVFSCATLTSGVTEVVVPLLPVAALTAIAHNLPLLAGAAGAAAVLKAGAFHYLRSRGAIDFDVNVGHHEDEHHGGHGHSHGGHGHSSGGYGGSHGHGAASAGYGRGIQAHKEFGLEVATSEHHAVSADPRVEKLVAYDKMGCGFKLMCELAAMPETRLEDDEKIILALYGNENMLRRPKKESHGKNSFGYASLLGKMSRDLEVCSRMYRRCPHERRRVMDALRSATN